MVSYQRSGLADGCSFPVRNSNGSSAAAATPARKTAQTFPPLRAACSQECRESKERAAGRRPIPYAMTPRCYIEIALEETPCVRVDFMDDGDERRLEDWLGAHPQYAALIAQAVELSRRTAA